MIKRMETLADYVRLPVKASGQKLHLSMDVLKGAHSCLIAAG